MNYVIIGNSAAGVAAAQGIRSVDESGSITIISDEPHTAYSRPMISDLLAGHVDRPEQMYYRKPEFYEQANLTPMLGRRVASVDAEAKKVHLEGGEDVDYDKLLLATGGVPFVPPMEGSDHPCVSTFTKWSDAQRVIEIAQNSKKAVVIGGGLIGTKAAEALQLAGIQTTIVELASRILSTALDETGSRIMEKHLREDVGMDVVTENSVVRILSEGEQVTGVLLRDGNEIECDMVMVAIGVRPNVELAETAGLKVNRGIAVDKCMRTSDPDIYAAGDVAEGYDVVADLNRPVPIWPLAYRQGRIAGLNMAGVITEYPGGMPMNSIALFDLPTISAGLSNPPETGDYEILEETDWATKSHRRLVLKDNVIVGMALVNEIDRAGILTGLIQDKTDVTSFKAQLMSDEFGLISLPKGWRQAHLTTRQ